MAEDKLTLEEIGEILAPEKDFKVSPKAQAIIESLKHIGPKMAGSIGKKV